MLSTNVPSLTVCVAPLVNVVPAEYVNSTTWRSRSSVITNRPPPTYTSPSVSKNSVPCGLPPGASVIVSINWPVLVTWTIAVPPSPTTKSVSVSQS